MSDFHIIIPARYDSTRLPGKALVDIAGQPMIQWVYESARKAGAESITVATDDQRIVDACRAFGAAAVLTGSDHASGTDRIAECARRLGLVDDAVVVNLQGDEPLTPPEALDCVAVALAGCDGAQVATLCAPITCAEELHNPHVVKVVFDHDGYALYFSRAAIPWHRESFAIAPHSLPIDTSYYRHIGIYAYRMSYLQALTQLPLCKSEQAESLEQLRALHYGGKIHLSVFADEIPPGVDTDQDLERVRYLLEGAR